MTYLQFRASRTLGWNPIKIGAGGFITRGEIAADGTKVCRADTYGAFLYSGSRWEPLITTTSMPLADYGPSYGEGVYEICIAPGNTNVFYMAFRGYVYKSTNRGTSWSRTSLTQFSPCEPNGTYRAYGPKMAVNPSDANHVIIGTQDDGAWQTFDGGSNWALISDVPVSSDDGGGRYPGHCVAFGSSSVIYVSSYGNGVYRSTDTGSSFSLTSSGPDKPINWAVSSTGVLYTTAEPYSGANVYKFASGSWSNLSTVTNGPYKGIAVDPDDPTHIMVAGPGTTPTNQSFDSGSTWTGAYQDASPATVSRVATDIPWLAVTNETYMTNGSIAFDPTDGKLYTFEGIGVWKTTHPTTWDASSHVVWTSASLGIEQLVANIIISPPSGSPVCGFWDRPVFKITDFNNYPSGHGPSYTDSIQMCWSLDYASSSPGHIVGLFNWAHEESGYSTDGGATWNQFSAKPAHIMDERLNIGGAIAASTPNNIVWVPSNNGSPYYTKDGGATWTEILLSGVPTWPSETGYGFAYYTDFQCVAADRVTANKFYLYNYLKGVYRSTDSGDNWTLAYATPFSGSGVNSKIRAVPGHAGHVVFTAGNQDAVTTANPANVDLYRSTDSGDTWAAVPNVKECYDISFGAQIGSGYNPTVFIVGWVSSVFGIWRSTDFDQATPTWTKIGDYPLGSIDHIKTISGDMNQPGVCYVGFAGSGAAYYTP